MPGTVSQSRKLCPSVCVFQPEIFCWLSNNWAGRWSLLSLRIMVIVLVFIGLKEISQAAAHRDILSRSLLRPAAAVAGYSMILDKLVSWAKRRIFEPTSRTIAIVSLRYKDYIHTCKHGKIYKKMKYALHAGFVPHPWWLCDGVSDKCLVLHLDWPPKRWWVVWDSDLISCIFIIFWNVCPDWQRKWPLSTSRSVWPIFHGQVSLLNMWHTSWIFIILETTAEFNMTNVLIILDGHCDQHHPSNSTLKIYLGDFENSETMPFNILME